MTYLYGIDISQHQLHTPNLANVDFVFARATYGAHGDSGYLVHEQNVRKARKVFGAYHFSRPITTGDTVAEQVRAFLLMAKDAELLALDWEEDVYIDANGVKRSNGRMTATDARKFIAAVHAEGRPIGLYASAAIFRDLGQDFDWVAKWGLTPPKRHWDIWQYDGGGVDHLDNDRFNGTVAQLRALGDPAIPDTSTEDGMLPFTILSDTPGNVTVSIDGAAAILLKTGGVFQLAKGISKRAYALVKLDAPFDAAKDDPVTPFNEGDRQTGYLIGGPDPAILFQYAAKFTPDPVADCTAAVEAAVAASEAGEAKRIADAIAADRAKATVGVIYR